MDVRSWSPSFKVAVGLLVVAVIGYAAWYVFKPNPIARSEMVVRQFDRAVGEKSGPFRAAVREVQRSAGATAELRQAARDRIDTLAREMNDAIEDLTDQAVSDVESISGIGLRTQENRLGRIRRISLEGRARVGQIVAEAKAALATDAAP